MRSVSQEMPFVTSAFILLARTQSHGPDSCAGFWEIFLQEGLGLEIRGPVILQEGQKGIGGRYAISSIVD